MLAYRNTQIGWGMVVILLLGLLIAAIVAVRSDLIGGLSLALVTVAFFALFGTMTVTLDETDLTLWFGIGAFRKRIAFNQVRAFRPVRNPWYYGWGIRWFPGGWLYNVWGFLAVELLLHTGTRVRVGTSEPEALIAQLQRVVGNRPPLTTAEIQAERRRARISILVLVGAILAPFAIGWTALYALTKPPTVSVSQAGFSVSSVLYGEEIPLERVTGVTLEQTLPRVLQRNNGLAFRRTLRGQFRLAEIGDGQLFVELGRPPYVMVRTKTDYVIVNFDDPARTRELYADLAARVGKF
jgi:hypothetical protein